MPEESKQCCCSQGGSGGCGGQNSQCGKTGGCSGENRCCGRQNRVIYITDDEKAFLMKLSEIPFLPLVRFLMRSTKSEDMSVALAPVYLNDKDESMDTVKENGEVLTSLEDKYMITLDYDLPLQNGNYSMYEESALYRDFCRTVREGVSQDGLIYDIPVLQRGSMALTSLGQDAVDTLE